MTTKTKAIRALNDELRCASGCPLVAPQGPGCYLGFLLGRGRGHFSAQMVYDPNRGVLSGIWDAPQVPAAPPPSPTRRRSRGYLAKAML
jgi:hypothetical protein